MRQELDGILPKKRSSVFFRKKQLSDEAKQWLILLNITNWLKIRLVQDYLKVSKKGKTMMKIIWKLPGTSEAKSYCGEWITKGCFNASMHPQGLVFISRTKRSCFRSECEKCWLEKWLARESSRATRRIEKFKDLKLSGRKKPIHVIVSPPWKDKFMRYDILKKKCRTLLKKAGVVGGLMIYHPFAYDEKNIEWVKRPHFHVIGYGWVVDTKKISQVDGWVIKNKGIRKSVHSTVYYLLSHAGVSRAVHSVTWFGELGYRSKYAEQIKVEDEEPHEFCDFCGFMFVNAHDRPPPDYEFVGLVDSSDWEALESVDEAVERKEQMKNMFKKKERVVGPNWLNLECEKASLTANAFGKRVMDNKNCEASSEFLTESGTREMRSRE